MAQLYNGYFLSVLLWQPEAIRDQQHAGSLDIMHSPPAP